MELFIQLGFATIAGGYLSFVVKDLCSFDQTFIVAIETEYIILSSIHGILSVFFLTTYYWVDVYVLLLSIPIHFGTFCQLILFISCCSCEYMIIIGREHRNELLSFRKKYRFIHMMPLCVFLLSLLEYFFPSLKLICGLFCSMVFYVFTTVYNNMMRVERICSLLNCFQEKERNKQNSTMQFVVHEIRVPINSLLLGLDILDDELAETYTDNRNYITNESKNVMYDTLSIMKNSLKFMNTTLSDFLSLQKIKNGLMELTYNPFQVVDLIKSVQLNYWPSFQKKNINVQTFIDSNLPKVIIGDRFYLEHVLVNLISNSIKFSPDNSVIEITIEVDDSKPNKEIVFRVRDQGIGISRDEADRLFDPFYQVKGENSSNGTGLGLSICKNIISSHGGIVSVKPRDVVSAENSNFNCEFSFSIPLKVPETGIEQSFDENSKKEFGKKSDSLDSEHSESSSSFSINKSKHSLRRLTNELKKRSDSQISKNSDKRGKNLVKLDIKKKKLLRLKERIKRSLNQNSSNGSSPHSVKSSTNSFQDLNMIAPINVLICDDTVSNRKLLEMILRKKVLSIETCNNGMEAIKLCNDLGLSYFDLIIIDNYMPKMNGIEATKELRRMGFNHLIICLTGSTDDETKDEILNSGADAFFYKPINNEIIDLILKHCATHDSLHYTDQNSIQRASLAAISELQIKSFF